MRLSSCFTNFCLRDICRCTFGSVVTMPPLKPPLGRVFPRLGDYATFSGLSYVFKNGTGFTCPLSMFRDLRIPSLTHSAGVQLLPCSAFRRRITPPFPGMTSSLPLPSGQLRPLKSSLPCYLPQRPELVCGLFPGSGQALLDFTRISGHTRGPPGPLSGNRSETGPVRLLDISATG